MVVKAVLQVILLIPAGAAGLLAFLEDFAKFPLVNSHKLFSGDFFFMEASVTSSGL